MTVKQFAEFLLLKFPHDLEVLNGRYSDYELIKEDELSVVKAVPGLLDDWVTRYHGSMSAAQKQRAREYVLIAGN